jgi:hypothetical protein
VQRREGRVRGELPADRMEQRNGLLARHVEVVPGDPHHVMLHSSIQPLNQKLL